MCPDVNCLKKYYEDSKKGSKHMRKGVYYENSTITKNIVIIMCLIMCIKRVVNENGISQCGAKKEYMVSPSCLRTEFHLFISGASRFSQLGYITTF